VGRGRTAGFLLRRAFTWRVPGGGGTFGIGELNIDFFFGNIKLDSSGAVGLKISDVPNGTLETETSLPNNDLKGVLGTKICNSKLLPSSSGPPSAPGGGGKVIKNGGSLMKTKYIYSNEKKKRKLNGEHKCCKKTET
jgi:hypothetical protein